LRCVAVEGQALAQFVGKVIQQSLVTGGVDAWVFGAAKQQRSGFEVELGALFEAELNECIVGLLALVMLDEVARLFAEQGIRVEQVGLEPIHDDGSARKQAIAGHFHHHGIIIGQELNQRAPLTRREIAARFDETRSVHPQKL
jgi:hypothetical protein